MSTVTGAISAYALRQQKFILKATLLIIKKAIISQLINCATDGIIEQRNRTSKTLYSLTHNTGANRSRNK